MSRTKAKRYSYHDEDKEDYIIISINEGHGNPNHFCRDSKYLKDVLYMFFDDIDHENDQYITMTKKDAEQIKKFIDRWKNKVNTIVIHCHAGISRSSGVACAISRYLNGNDLDIWQQGIYSPNKLCYRRTCRAFEIEVTEEELQYRRDINEYVLGTWDEENRNILKKMIVK